MQEEELIYDWNFQGIPASQPVALRDEILWNRLKSPSVRIPPMEKRRILHWMESPEQRSSESAANPSER